MVSALLASFIFNKIAAKYAIRAEAFRPYMTGVDNGRFPLFVGGRERRKKKNRPLSGERKANERNEAAESVAV